MPMPWTAPPDRRRADVAPLHELDRRIARGAAAGLVIVDGPQRERDAAFAHVVRRAKLAGRPCVAVDGRDVPEPWRLVGRRLGLRGVQDAFTFARGLSRALGADRVLVVATRGEVTQWGQAVLEGLSEATLGGVVIALGRYRVRAPRLVLDAVARRDDALSFYEALSATHRASALSEPGLADIARWWSAPSPSPGAEVVTDDEPSFDDRVVEGSAAQTDPWRAMDVAEHLAARAPHAARSGTDQALPRAHQSLPWARRALDLAPDAASRADLWARFIDTWAERMGPDDCVSFAETALAQGDGNQALRLMTRCPVGHGFRAALVRGRAAMARGDVPRSAESLLRAVDLATDGAERAEATVALGELRLASGRRDLARRLAEDALDREPPPATQIAARNLLGKVLLAEGRWPEAEDHFAHDEALATGAGRRGDVLRARVNRAIATMSQERRLEARTLLETVLEDGEAEGDGRAVAFALGNLAVLHSLAHDYATALEQFERCMGVVRALGDAFRLAHNTFNLAHLRIRVGMVEEAEQTLAFGRRACGPQLADNIAALMSFVSAEARLARGDTLAAAPAAAEAVAASKRSNNGAKLGEALRLQVRIALADGEVTRAERALHEASSAPPSAGSAAALAVLKAAVARASGAPYRHLADAAVVAAREDLELAREAHTLAGAAAFDEGAFDHAHRHARAAAAHRDRIADHLPEAMRSAYLGRPDLADLRRLEARLADAATSQPSDATESTIEATDRPVASGVRRAVAPKHNGCRPTLVGTTPAMKALRAAIDKLGPSEATVLIAGESGTGKELVADALHRASARADGPLVKVNCAALVETLLLSELFGHERGAFTGAHHQKRGLFEHAHGGTIFLDEIGDISPKTQVALLRVLQERSFERVGGCGSIHVDTRVVCATHRNLRQMVSEGTFREDLYYRLCGVKLDVPALRDRAPDLPDLAAALLVRIAREQRTPPKRLSPEATALLAQHRWPGNVRELQNALRAAALFAEGELITARDVTDHVDALARASDTLDHAPNPPDNDAPSTSASNLAAPNPSATVYRAIRSAGTSLPNMKKALERACIERALEETGGNITRAAALLGMKRPRVSQLVHQFARDDQASGEKSR
ncbi:MAG: sigma 54-interacting transcriptional regulator [Myxococcota bacterium]